MKQKKKKNEYSAWELITPFRLYETGFDKVQCSHSVVPISVSDNSLLLQIHSVH